MVYDLHAGALLARKSPGFWYDFFPTPSFLLPEPGFPKDTAYFVSRHFLDERLDPPERFFPVFPPNTISSLYKTRGDSMFRGSTLPHSGFPLWKNLNSLRFNVPCVSLDDPIRLPLVSPGILGTGDSN